MVDLCPKGSYLSFGYHTGQLLVFSGDTNLYAAPFAGFDAPAAGAFVSTTPTSSVNGGGGDPNGCLVAYGWTSQDELTAYVTVYNMLSQKLYFTYQSDTNTATQNQNIVSGVSQHMQYTAVSLWGDGSGLDQPTLIVFDLTGEQLFSYTSRGSMLDVTLAYSNATGSLFLTGAGKATHANELGSGGDAYAFEIQV
jgi:hypothetical protein